MSHGLFVWVVACDDNLTVLHKRIKTSHIDAVPRALAHAKELARRAANQLTGVPDYQVIAHGQPIWRAHEDHDILNILVHMHHGDMADATRRYRRRTW